MLIKVCITIQLAGKKDVLRGPVSTNRPGGTHLNKKSESGAKVLQSKSIAEPGRRDKNSRREEAEGRIGPKMPALLGARALIQRSLEGMVCRSSSAL